MQITWERILPVLVSIGVIILVAVLRQYSKSFAAIAAVMPLNVPLGMWIIYSGADDKQSALAEFNEALVVNMIPTLFFLAVAWYGSRAGWGLLTLRGAGSGAGGVTPLMVLPLRGALSG